MSTKVYLQFDPDGKDFTVKFSASGTSTVQDALSVCYHSFHDVVIISDISSIVHCKSTTNSQGSFHQASSFD